MIISKQLYEQECSRNIALERLEKVVNGAIVEAMDDPGRGEVIRVVYPSELSSAVDQASNNLTAAGWTVTVDKTHRTLELS